jgi:enoyl-CoA hydratase/carnithine racemase
VYRHLTVEEHGGVALVRIDRPPANAMDLELLEEGARLVDELASSDPGAVVITGRDGFFSAGVDLKVAPQLDADGQRAMVTGINRLFGRWYGFPRPLVCAVNGHAIAGGLILALCGDHRVGARHGKLGVTELRAGIPYPAVAMLVVKFELTPQVARRLVLGADLVDPETGLQLGLIDELQPDDRLLERSLELASDLAALPHQTYSLVKRQLRGEALERIDRILAGEADPVASSWVGDEAADASAALLGRAEPG